MTKNVGIVDRVIRISLGLGILTLLVVLPQESPYRWLGLIGLVPIATAIIGWCPAYTLFNIKTP